MSRLLLIAAIAAVATATACNDAAGPRPTYPPGCRADTIVIRLDSLPDSLHVPCHRLPTPRP